MHSYFKEQMLKWITVPAQAAATAARIITHCIASALIILSVTASAQNTGEINGTVTDAGGKKGLPGASIVIADKNIGTLTDNAGNFVLKGIPAGYCVIRVSFVGYQTYQRKTDLKKNEKLHLMIRLRDTVISSAEVQIVAEKNKDDAELSQRVNTIRSSQIGSAPVQTIHEILDYSTGVNVGNPGGIFSGKAVVSMRGLPANDQSRTLVILDGVPLNKSDEGSVNWNMIDKNTIERVQVIKGPGPAKYGSGAMGGVIELFTKKPAKKIEGGISVDYGTYNTVGSNIFVQGAVKPASKKQSFYWGLTGSGRMSDGYISEPVQFIDVADSILRPVFLKEVNAGVKAGCDFSGNNNIEMQFGYFDDMRGNGVKIYDNYGAWQKHRTYKSLLKYSGSKKAFRWNTVLYDLSENYYRIYEYLKDGEYVLYQADATRGDVGGNFSVSFSGFSHQEITAGAAGRFGSVNGTDTYYSSTDIIHNKGNMDEFSFFIQDEIKLLHEKITVNAGLRYDMARFHNGLFSIDQPSYSIAFYKEFEDLAMADRRWNALCPRLSAAYRFSPENRLYVAVAKGFRAPVLDDMCRTGKKKSGFKVANPALQPEKMLTFELGGDVSPLKDLTASVSLYYNIGTDFMYYVSNGDTANMGYKLSPVVEKQNIGKVEIRGTEIELRYDLREDLSVFAGYSFNHALITKHVVNDPLIDSSLTGKFLTDIPDHKASAGITWRNRIVNTTIIYKYIGRVWINDLNDVPFDYFTTSRYPDYGIFSIRFERHIYKLLSASMSVENIFDKIYFDSELQRCPGRFITATLKFNFSSKN